MVLLSENVGNIASAVPGMVISIEVPREVNERT